MKLHLGCGPIYLEGYINVDANADYFANAAPEDIFQKNLTTFDKYYKHEFGKASKIVIVDICADILKLPFENNSIEEIILMHVLEHFPIYKARKLLDKIYNMLENNGRFIVAVPHIKKTAELLTKNDNPQEEDFCIRLIHGTQKNEWSHHYCGFTERTLQKLLEEHGFSKFEILPNINFYPAVHLKAFKGGKYEIKS